MLSPGLKLAKGLGMGASFASSIEASLDSEDSEGPVVTPPQAKLRNRKMEELTWKVPMTITATNHHICPFYR